VRYLQLGFAGEGATDHDFFCILVTRVVQQLVLNESSQTVQVPEALSVRPGGAFGNAPLEVATCVADEYDYLDLLFFHADARSDPRAADENLVDVVRRKLALPVVGVVPRREMEAWILACPSAVAEVLGLPPAALETRPEHRPRQVESILDPKTDLRRLVDSAPVRRRRAVGTDDLMSRLGETIDIDVLRSVPQGRVFVDDTRSALTTLGVIE
jgi:Domain of unknown function (DUF4276)